MRKLLFVTISAALIAALAGKALAGGPKPDEPGRSVRRPPEPEGDRAKGPPSSRSPGPGAFGPGSGGKRPRRRFKPLSKEQEKEVLDYLKKKQPELYKQTLAHREQDVSRYQRAIRWIWHSLERRRHLPEEVSDAYDVRQYSFVRMWRLAKELHEARDDATKKDLGKRLRVLAEKLFDADQIIRGHRLKLLEDQIKHLKEELKERAQNRSVVIEEDLERMKEQAERMGPHRRGPGSRPSGPSSRPGESPRRGPHRFRTPPPSERN